MATFTRYQKAGISKTEFGGYFINIFAKNGGYGSIGISSTTGSADLHLTFFPSEGYTVWGHGMARDSVYNAENLASSRAVLFPGASFPLQSPVFCNLTGPISTLSFNSGETGAKMGFRIVESQLSHPLIEKPEHSWIQLLVTEKGDVLPIGLEPYSIRSQASELLNLVPKTLAAIKEKLFRVSYEKQTDTLIVEKKTRAELAFNLSAMIFPVLFQAHLQQKIHGKFSEIKLMGDSLKKQLLKDVIPSLIL
ncbi:MAG: hypothetical protein KA715_12205 [Xanthomonadaceae bacterium]|nr:hypothetical protein [Xanthomonadaceae bacterium]